VGAGESGSRSTVRRGQKLSPFYHYAVGDPLREGVSFTHTAVLVAITVVATALAPWFFSRRDVAT
jgi:hypothetical protein